MKKRIGHQRRFDERWTDTRKSLISPIQYRFKCTPNMYRKVEQFVLSKLHRGYTLRHFYEDGRCYVGHFDSMKVTCFLSEFYNSQSGVSDLERIRII